MDRDEAIKRVEEILTDLKRDRYTLEEDKKIIPWYDLLLAQTLDLEDWIKSTR